MPQYCAIPLLIDGASVGTGGAFELAQRARESATVKVNGWDVEVRAGHDVVVARGRGEDRFADAYVTALTCAQKGLDLMSISGSNNLVINAFDTDFLVWWPEPQGLVIRICALSSLQIDSPPVTLVHKDADGNVLLPAPQAPMPWHESYRYFRLSQTTDDLFDAYRNAYLALESVLSSIAPQSVDATGRVDEGESQWFRRALTEAGRLVPLAAMVPQSAANPVQALVDELYRDMRSAMSHAKSGRAVLLPRDESERNRVSVSLQRLVNLYLKLAERHFGARRLGGGIFAVAFRGAYEPFLSSMTAVVSDDSSPFDVIHKVPNPAGGALCNLQPASDPQSPEPFAVTRLWSVPCAELSDLPFVRRVVGLHLGKPALVGVLRGPLQLGASHRLEVLFGIRGENARQTRQRYSY